MFKWFEDWIDARIYKRVNEAEERLKETEYARLDQLEASMLLQLQEGIAYHINKVFEETEGLDAMVHDRVSKDAKEIIQAAVDNWYEGVKVTLDKKHSRLAEKSALMLASAEEEIKAILVHNRHSIIPSVVNEVLADPKLLPKIAQRLNELQVNK